MEKENENVQELNEEVSGVNEELLDDEMTDDGEVFQMAIKDFIDSLDSEDFDDEGYTITDEEVANFKELYISQFENGEMDKDFYDTEFISDDELVKKFLISLKKRMDYYADRSNFSEEENLAREKRIAYMESRLGEIMVSIGKSEDFPFEELTEDERVRYFEKYVEIMEEFDEVFKDEE